jgi:hypothetical protein
LIYYFAWGARARLPEQTRLVDGNDDNDDNDGSDGIDASPGIAVSPPMTPTIAVPCDTRRYAEMCSTVVVLVVAGVATAASALAKVQQDLYQQESQIEVWGGVATLTNAIMWLPQIMETRRLQHGGVLSVAALLFSAFGDFFLGAYWVWEGEKFWIWGSLVADSLMQLVLIGMVLYYRRRDESDTAPSSLTEPLLDNDQLETGDAAGEASREPEGPTVEL